jgi:hypothetical protein
VAEVPDLTGIAFSWTSNGVSNSSFDSNSMLALSASAVKSVEILGPTSSKSTRRLRGAPQFPVQQTAICQSTRYQRIRVADFPRFWRTDDKAATYALGQVCMAPASNVHQQHRSVPHHPNPPTIQPEFASVSRSNAEKNVLTIPLCPYHKDSSQ